MQCTLIKLPPDFNIRKEYFQKVNKPNILQDPAYGFAMQKLERQTPEFYAIEIDQKPAGCVQIMKKAACRNVLQAVMVDRGPLWCEGYGTDEHFEAFLRALRALYPCRLGRVVRFMPEIEDTTRMDAALKQHKFRRKSDGYQTIMLDLAESEEDLRANLKKNWRSQLQKAEKTGLGIEWDMDGVFLDWLLKFYRFDKKTKGYEGPSVELLKAIAHESMADGDVKIARAVYRKKSIAAILLFCHGRSATYQIGWNTQEGRGLGAHNFLLWNAALHLKQNGFEQFDLGGINDSDAKNVTQFKDGMGGRRFSLAGLYS